MRTSHPRVGAKVQIDELRVVALRTVTELGRVLLVTPATRSVAMILFHRFYMYVKVSEYETRYALVATACLLLAGKRMEDSRQMRDLINAFLAVNDPTNVCESFIAGKQYKRIKTALAQVEHTLIQTLHFDLTMRAPVVYLGAYCQLLGYSNDDVSRKSLQMCNDLNVSPIVALVNPATLALGILLCCEKMYGFDKLFTTTVEGTPLLECLNSHKEEVLSIAVDIAKELKIFSEAAQRLDASISQ